MVKEESQRENPEKSFFEKMKKRLDRRMEKCPVLVNNRNFHPQKKKKGQKTRTCQDDDDCGLCTIRSRG